MRNQITSVCLTLLLLPNVSAANINDLICDDRNRLEDQLSSVHGAEKQGQGMRGPDALIEVWITPRSGDWTLVQSYANGTACIVAMGQYWQSLQTGIDPA